VAVPAFLWHRSAERATPGPQPGPAGVARSDPGTHVPPADGKRPKDKPEAATPPGTSGRTGPRSRGHGDREKTQQYMKKRKAFTEKWTGKYKPELIADLIEDAAKEGFTLDELLSCENVSGEDGGWGPLFKDGILMDIALYLLKQVDYEMRVQGLDFLRGLHGRSDWQSIIPTIPVSDVRALALDADPRIQLKALAVLARMGDDTIKPAVVQMLSADNSGTVQEAIDLLYYLKAIDCLGDIARLLSHPDEGVRLGALRFCDYLTIKDPSISPQLAELLSDPSPQVKRATLKVVRQLPAGDENLISRLGKLLSDPDVEVRKTAFSAIRGMQAKELIPDVVRFLDDGNNEIVKQAVRTLVKLQAAEYLAPHMPKLLSNPAVLCTTLYAIGRLRMESFLPDVLKAAAEQKNDLNRECAAVVSVMLIANAPIPEIHEDPNEDFEPSYDISVFQRTEAFYLAVDKLMSLEGNYDDLKCLIMTVLTRSDDPLSLDAARKSWQKFRGR